MREQKDFGLLILRGAGLLLLGTFGVQKIGWHWSAFHAGKSLSSAGLAPLIARMGFPISFVLALWITFNESIGAILIGCRFLTRLLAASAALGMAGGTLYQRSTRRRLAQGGALLDRLHGLSLNRSWQIFRGSSSPAQEIPRAKS
jgi:uncharacterized membrane protein YphA (DoxX/SURF4 family)